MAWFDFLFFWKPQHYTFQGDQNMTHALETIKSPPAKRAGPFASDEAWRIARTRFMFELQRSVMLKGSSVPPTRFIDLYLLLRSGLVELGDGILFDIQERKVVQWKPSQKVE